MSSVLSTSTPVATFAPVRLSAPYRGIDLEVRVSTPAAGTGLPVIVFAHGYGWSMHGYAPLVNAWAAAGFVVLQPTFLDSRLVDLSPDDPRMPDIWRTRVRDMQVVLDELQTIEDTVPGLAGRMDRGSVVVAGHSWGAQTASMLLGARVREADGTVGPSEKDPRVRAGVLLPITGDGHGLTEFAAANFGFMRPDFTDMSVPALVVAGDQDDSPLSTRGPDWFTDAFTLSPGSKALLTVAGGEHSLGGISGYDVAETTDASPVRVALVADATTAWLQAEVSGDGSAWRSFTERTVGNASLVGRLESK